MISHQTDFLRGNVYLVKFYLPDDPNEPINKFIVNLQEGKIVDNSPTFVGVNITTGHMDIPYPSDVYISEEESGCCGGAKIMCNQIHTIPKVNIIEFKYKLSDITMEKVDEKLLLGTGIVKIEDLELNIITTEEESF